MSQVVDSLPPVGRRDISEVYDTLRALVLARYRLRGVRRGDRVRCYGALLVPRRSGVEIGAQAAFLRGAVPTELRCEPGATLFIGAKTIVNYGVFIGARRCVRIGADCMIASFVHVRDDDGRRTEPVTIGDGVWIAHGAIIEPGSTIGDGTVVAAMAVVSGVVPPRSLVTGNPGQCFPLDGNGQHAAAFSALVQAPGGSPVLVAPRRGGPSRDEVRAAILRWLDDTRLFGDAARRVASDDVSLREEGLLDSLGVVQLVVMLEKRFGVVVDRDRLADRGAQTLAGFIDLATVSRAPAGALAPASAAIPLERAPASVPPASLPPASMHPASISPASVPPASIPPPSVPPRSVRTVSPAAAIGAVPARDPGPLLHPVDLARKTRSQLSDFARFVAGRTGRAFGDYAALHAFSVEEIEVFWGLFLEWSRARVGGEAQPVCVGAGVRDAHFFPQLELSWPENVLAPRAPEEEEAPAIIACDETGGREELSRAALRLRVRAAAAALASFGLRPGDRVAAVVRNTIDTVVACLAVTSVGASWSSVAPDMGLESALARLGPLQPAILFAHGVTRANGARVEVPVAELAAALPSLRGIVSLDDQAASKAREAPRTACMTLEGLERDGRAGGATGDPGGPWQRFPFEQPLFVLFSSGTTGPPKCIVHGHGGTLLEHLKEHRLHCDLGPADRLLFHTNTGWMMWNWTVSALATGATIVLYDGSVSHPRRDGLLRIAAQERVTVLGTSPAYLQYLVDAGVDDARSLLTTVREVHSTGSVLGPRLHRWARDRFADAPLQSISGGTDVLGCFVMGSPWTDTFEGESSCIGLGLDVRAWGAAGAAREGTGELVCGRPFPSRPVGFLDDADGARMHAAYFAQHEGFWTHGDLVQVTARASVRVLGRCDGVLNIRGIRIGPTEIYDVIARCIPEVAQAMAVDQAAPAEPGGRRLVLFVVLRPASCLDRALRLRIKRELKRCASSAHVPSALVAVNELPATFNGKLSEAALQDALSGRPVRNRDSLRNPAAIDEALHALRAEDARA